MKTQLKGKRSLSQAGCVQEHIGVFGYICHIGRLGQRFGYFFGRFDTTQLNQAVAHFTQRFGYQLGRL